MKKGEMHPLRVARCQHNLTIVELAEEAKVGASTIWRAEHHYAINAESRRRLCTFFNMAPQELGLLGPAKQDITFERRRPKAYPFIEPCTPVYVAEKVSTAQLPVLSEGTDVQQFFTQYEQVGSVSALEVDGLVALLESITNLIASALYFQQYYKVSSDAPQKVDQAATANLDIWKQAQRLGLKAAAVSASGQQFEPAQFIEAALRLLESQEWKDYQQTFVGNRNSLKSLSPVFGQQPSFVDY